MNSVIDGVEINERGGKQSALGARWDLIPPQALKRVAEILEKGAKKYEEENWRKLTIRDNINHCIAHLYAWLEGEPLVPEDDLGNAACRALFALELKLTAGRGFVPESQS